MSNDIFFNLNNFIENTTELLNKFKFNHIKTYNDFDEVVNPFFDKYEKKAKITKGVVKGKKYKDLLEYKHKHLTVLLNDSTELSNNIQFEKHITEDNLLDYMIKSIIDNRLIPILKFVIYELAKVMQSFETKNDLNNAIDLSDTKGTEKIIMITQLGILDFLKEQQPFLNVNALASVISGITGVKQVSVYPMINTIIKKDSNINMISQKNNPFNTKKTVAKINQKIISAGFIPK